MKMRTPVSTAILMALALTVVILLGCGSAFAQVGGMGSPTSGI